MSNTPLISARSLVNNYLTNFLTDTQLNAKLQLAFGNSINLAQAIALIQGLISGDNFPLIEVIPTADINNADGAFASSNGKVYLAQELVDNNNVGAIAHILTEELGHYLDHKLNSTDSEGDEGDIFSRLVRGEDIDNTTLQALKAEDDQVTVTLNGQVVQIEQGTILSVPPVIDHLSDSLDLLQNGQDSLSNPYKDKFHYANVQKITPNTYRARFKDIIVGTTPNIPYDQIPGTPGGTTTNPTTINPLSSTIKGLLIHTAANNHFIPTPSVLTDVGEPWTSTTGFSNLVNADSFLNTIAVSTTGNTRHLFAEDTYTGTTKNIGILRHNGGPAKVTLNWDATVGNDLDLWLTTSLGGLPIHGALTQQADTTFTNDNIEQYFNSSLPSRDYYIYVGDYGNYNRPPVFTQDFSIFATAQPKLNQGHGWGDVHLVTNDGKAYDFQAVGEFILIESLIDDFQVQTRQKPWGNSTRVSVNTAFATKIDGFNVIFDTELPVGQELSVGGLTQNLLSGDSILLGNSQIKRKGNEYIFTYVGPDGILSTADDDRVTVKDRENHLNIYVNPADYRFGLIQGLLGNGDGISTNDFALRDGTNLGYPSVQTIHTTYADSWRITQEESLFGTPTFADRNFPEEYTSLETLRAENPQAVAEALKKARAAGIPEGNFLEGAVLDFLVTGEESFIDGAKEFADFVHENNDKTETPDLVVSSFNITDEAFIRDDNLILPIEVVVQNQGNAPADLFKIDVQYSHSGNPPFVVAFTADDTSEVNPDNLWYPFTRNPLEAGDEVTFTGELTFDDSLVGQPISLVATADSTSGDEFIPKYGRVEESNEDNNSSQIVEVTLEEDFDPSDPKGDQGFDIARGSAEALTGSTWGAETFETIVYDPVEVLDLGDFWDIECCCGVGPVCLVCNCAELWDTDPDLASSLNPRESPRGNFPHPF